jgi:hypothetical protein
MKKKLQPAYLFYDDLNLSHKAKNNRFAFTETRLLKSLKYLSQLFFVILLISGYAFAQVATAPAAGDGSAESPYEIATLENLYWIAEDPARWSYHYIQTANIDASETAGWFEGEGWMPIGNEENPFRGNYDGDSNIINGLFIDRGSDNYQGLFGFISSAGKVVNNLEA